LRRDERDARAPLASARLSALGARGSLWHRPDLVLWPRAGECLPTAVEVELTVKAPRRLEEICRAWARARCVAGAVYVAAPNVEPALARAIARAKAHERVVVVPLAVVVDGSSVPLAAVVEGSSKSPATLGDACAREPSQGARTLSGRGSTS
ncbi:MAG TPA: hypothetical protein VH115_02230, partial [Solirubrobacteraceae bacterium]|nr:hypothetical protein [Solirubrobacteraceae bacterium]